MVGEKLCKEVVSIVETRGRDYGDIKTNHEEIAKGWSVILGIDVKPHQVALCNDWQKTVRLKANPKHHDSYKDKMGYMITYSECIK